MNKNNTTIVISNAVINSGKNRNRSLSELQVRNNKIYDAYSGESASVQYELSACVERAKFSSIVSYVTATLGDDDKRVMALRRAMDVNDSDYRERCATTKDTTSVEWFVGRCFAGSLTDIAKVVTAALGGQKKSEKAMLKELHKFVIDSHLLDLDFFTNPESGLTFGEFIRNLYGKRKKYESVLSTEKFVDDLQQLVYNTLYYKQKDVD